jgi:hypothetical protein
MSLQGALIKFVAKDDQKTYFASIPAESNSTPTQPTLGTIAQGFNSLEDLIENRSAAKVTVERVRTSNLRCYAVTKYFFAVACSTPEPGSSDLLRWPQL